MRHFLFKVTAVTVFLAIVFEFLMLYFQLKRQLLTNMFHEKAFNIYKITVIFL